MVEIANKNAANKAKILENSNLFRGFSWVLFWMIFLGYRGFHITFDERVPKFVRNFRSWWRTWQLDYVVANQVGNFAAKFEITTRTSQPQFGTKFAEAWGIIMNPFTRQRKALPNNVREKIEDDYWHKIKGQQKSEKSWNSTDRF